MISVVSHRQKGLVKFLREEKNSSRGQSVCVCVYCGIMGKAGVLSRKSISFFLFSQPWMLSISERPLPGKPGCTQASALICTRHRASCPSRNPRLIYRRAPPPAPPPRSKAQSAANVYAEREARIGREAHIDAEERKKILASSTRDGIGDFRVG